MNLKIVTVSILALALTVLSACSEKRDVSRGPAKDASSGPAKAPEAKAPDIGKPLEVGVMMPRYSATTLAGANYDLADKRGKVLLLNIWATWCPPCRAETPDLVKLHERYKARGLEVVGVSIDEAGNADDVRRFAADFSVTYPIVFDPAARIADMFGTSIIPTSALVDRTGKITWIRQGMVHLDDSETIAAIEAALGV